MEIDINLYHHRAGDGVITLEQIMTAISDFAAKQTAFNAAIAALNDKIAALQASPGAITPEDQKTLDDLTAALQLRTDTAAASAAALDAKTPPVVPAA